MASVDQKIDKKIEGFRDWYRRQIRNRDAKAKRRGVGVCLLSDIKPKGLDDLPFRLPKQTAYRNSPKAITVFTDGSVIGTGPRMGRDKGPGGWAAVFQDGRTVSGREQRTTSNRMEIKAVIEALRQTPTDSLVIVRTDSQYVSQICAS